MYEQTGPSRGRSDQAGHARKEADLKHDEGENAAAEQAGHGPSANGPENLNAGPLGSRDSDVLGKKNTDKPVQPLVEERQHRTK